MVTHDLAEARRLADKIMVIDEGEIQQYDDRDVVLNNPSNDKVKDFIMNQY